MDIDVDRFRRAVEEQHHHRMTVAGEEILISAAHRTDQQLVAHRAAIDEEILIARGRPIERRQAGEASQAEVFALRRDGQRVIAELTPQHGGETHPARIAAGKIGFDWVQPQQCAVFIARHREGNTGISHRQTFDGIDNGVPFGTYCLEEFQPCGRRVEKIAHFDAGAVGQGRRHHLRFFAAFDTDRPGFIRAALAAGDRQAADGADRGQSLTAKTEMFDGEKIVVRKLRGAMTFDRQRQLIAIHSEAVIGDRDEALAAVAQRHLDAGRAGIDRVFDQFFDRRGGAFDDLAGGDAIDDDRRQLADVHPPIVPCQSPFRQDIGAR